MQQRNNGWICGSLTKNAKENRNYNRKIMTFAILKTRLCSPPTSRVKEKNSWEVAKQQILLSEDSYNI